MPLTRDRHSLPFYRLPDMARNFHSKLGFHWMEFQFERFLSRKKVEDFNENVKIPFLSQNMLTLFVVVVC